MDRPSGTYCCPVMTHQPFTEQKEPTFVMSWIMSHGWSQMIQLLSCRESWDMEGAKGANFMNGEPGAANCPTNNTWTVQSDNIMESWILMEGLWRKFSYSPFVGGAPPPQTPHSQSASGLPVFTIGMWLISTCPYTNLEGMWLISTCPYTNLEGVWLISTCPYTNLEGVWLISTYHYTNLEGMWLISTYPITNLEGMWLISTYPILILKEYGYPYFFKVSDWICWY